MKLAQLEALVRYVDNPLIKAVVAGAVVASAISATTAFAPVGVVGAGGWVVVYGVAGGTALFDLGERLLRLRGGAPINGASGATPAARRAASRGGVAGA